jgi:hypothetical protein
MDPIRTVLRQTLALPTYTFRHTARSQFLSTGIQTKAALSDEMQAASRSSVEVILQAEAVLPGLPCWHVMEQ